MHPDFLSPKNPKTLIIYGVSKSPSTFEKEWMGEENHTLERLRTNIVSLSPSSPSLRLNSKGWINISTQTLSELKSTDDLFENCKSQLLQNIDKFSISLNKFVSVYMDLILKLIDKNKLEIKKGIPEKEVFVYKDFIFSAYLPLLNSRILLPPSYHRRNAETPYFAHLDIVFWIDEELVCVNIGSKTSGIKSRRKAIEFLTTNYPKIRMINIDAQELTLDKFPITKFPTSFGKFWKTISTPMGPDARDFIIL